MTEYKTMRVPKDARQAAQEEKERLGLTWGEYLRLPANGDVTDVTENHDADTAVVDYAEIERRCERAVKNTLR